ISPEGCASILWKNAAMAAEAAETLGITARRLQGMGLVDEVLAEPLGGAHRDPEAVFALARERFAHHLQELQAMDTSKLLTTRYERLMHYGVVGAA
ncbi:acetyl-CoA carboxylase carboxyl transferase subunit alpha, partial [Acidithiobacillus ferrooxidans]|nr:acetyl-CoA carboxylase carboxyl transferase subunit alpha [Acidithiobacillus ferrooxidans]